MTQRLRISIEAMLLTAPDLKLDADKFAIERMRAAMSGAMRSVLDSGGSPTMTRKLRERLVLLGQLYLAAVTAKHEKIVRRHD